MDTKRETVFLAVGFQAVVLGVIMLFVGYMECGIYYQCAPNAIARKIVLAGGMIGIAGLLMLPLAVTFLVIKNARIKKMNQDTIQDSSGGVGRT